MIDMSKMNFRTICYFYLLLNPDITQADLAKRFNTNPMTFSRAINNPNYVPKESWHATIGDMLVEMDLPSLGEDLHIMEAARHSLIKKSMYARLSMAIPPYLKAHGFEIVGDEKPNRYIDYSCICNKEGLKQIRWNFRVLYQNRLDNVTAILAQFSRMIPDERYSEERFSIVVQDADLFDALLERFERHQLGFEKQRIPYLSSILFNEEEKTVEREFLLCSNKDFLL